MEGGVTRIDGNPVDPFVVATERVADALAIPFNVTDPGLALHVASDGAPLHVRLTV
jgi:hypothetical protein